MKASASRRRGVICNRLKWYFSRGRAGASGAATVIANTKFKAAAPALECAGDPQRSRERLGKLAKCEPVEKAE